MLKRVDGVAAAGENGDGDAGKQRGQQPENDECDDGYRNRLKRCQ